MNGRTYEVFVDGKPIGLVGSTIQSLRKRRSGDYVKRFGSSVELRIIREIPYPDGYSKTDYNFYLKACEALDIARKKTYVDDGGLNKISPLIQVLGHPMLESAMGKLGGRKAVESGQLDSIRSFENSSKGGRYHIHEQFSKIGIKGGHRRFELYGSPATIEGSRKGCYKRNLLYGNPATPESCSKAGKIGTLKQPRWAKVLGAQVAMHNRWHVRRNVVNPNCKFCVQSPSGIDVLEKAS